MTTKLLIYGAYGYTGELIVRLAQEKGFTPILAGRNAKKLKNLANQTGFETRTLGLNDRYHLFELLKDTDVCIHAAGPFSETARPMVDACLETRTHYLDITGEIAVFLRHYRLDQAARKVGIMIMSGTGFDVVPSDCLAAHVKTRLPDADRLILSIGGLGYISPGTAKTALEKIGEKTVVRRSGEIVPLQEPNIRSTDLGAGPVDTISVSWGDVATAWFTTAIPDISVYFQLTDQLKKATEIGPVTRRLLKNSLVRTLVKFGIEKTVHGPNSAQREKGRVRILAEAFNAAGDQASSRLETPEAYALTSRTCLDIAGRVLDGDFKTGFHTPAGQYGPDFILGFDGVHRYDL